MTDYLLDTSTFSLLMRDDPSVRARLAALSGVDRVVSCTIVRGEILYGIERLPQGKRRQALTAAARRIFDAVGWEPVPVAAAEAYALLKRAAESAGTALDENDLWIAAAAWSLGAVLVTSDRDFSRIASLTLEDWSGAATP